MIISLAKKLALVMGIAFILLITLALKFGYVDTDRIAAKPMTGLSTPTKNLVKIGSLFDYKDQINIANADDAQIKPFTKFYAKDLGRFKSPHQRFASFGRYPTRLEGLDGIFINAGEKLIFTSPFSTESLIEFYSGSFTGDGKIIIEHNQKREEFNAPAIKKQEPHSLYHEAIGKFLNVSDEGISKLSHNSIELKVATGETIAFECKSKNICFLGGVSFYQEIGTREDTKNVIFILVDTLRHDALTPFSAPYISSLKDFKSHKNTYAAGNMTSPSTNSLLSCQKPSSISEVAFSYSVGDRTREKYYNRHIAPFPSIFKHNGYKTAMVGNISVISEVFGVGVDHGFDYKVSTEEEGYETARAVTYATDYLSKNLNKNNFLYLHLNAPHAAYRPPLKNLSATYKGFSDLGSGHNVLRWLYRGEVHYVDSEIERLFNFLKDQKLYDSSTIIITSDHGDQFEKRKWINNTSGPAYIGSYFDHGATLFDDEVKVPFLVKSPLPDLPFFNKKIRSNLNTGHDLLKLVQLENQSQCAQFDEDSVFGIEGMRSRAIVFKGRYKYIKAFSPLTKKLWKDNDFSRKDAIYYAQELLFDLENDPKELENLANSNKALLQEAKDFYIKYYNQHSGFELVVESETEKKLTITIPGRPVVSGANGLNVSEEANQVRITGNLKGTKVIQLQGWHKPTRPTVRMDNKSVQVTTTNLRLENNLRLADLPHETGFLVPARSEVSTAANIRKIYTNEMTAKRISTGNPEFEKVLRQWGYLNDD